MGRGDNVAFQALQLVHRTGKSSNTYVIEVGL